MNLISFETPSTKAKEASPSSSTCFHSHLDLCLGISLTHGGCGDAGCGTKAGHGGRGGGGGGGDVGCMSNGIATAAAKMVAASHGRKVASNWPPAFMPSPTAFMHPWSLAARQQKAAAEQDRGGARASTFVPRDARIVTSPAAAVGWPPVHTSRRNLASVHLPKPDTAAVVSDEPKVDGKMAGTSVKASPPPSPAEGRPYMFAKVHMEGNLIGRKINLRAHRSYDSLSRVLKKMTKNFFCLADYASGSREEDCGGDEEFIFLYEDYEGDRMLVGDVPWELFLASAKRLYIARNPAVGDKSDEGPTKDVPEEGTK